MYQGLDPFYLILKCNFRGALEISSHIRRSLLLDIEYLSDLPLLPLLLAGDCTVPLEMLFLIVYMQDPLMGYNAF